MKMLEDLIRAVGEYSATERHPALPGLAVSNLYCLLEAKAPEGYVMSGSWKNNDEFPSSSLPGVYAVLARDLGVMYVGKAIYGLQYRLLQHFPEDLAGQPAIPEKWPSEPTFLVTIGEPDADAWHRPASLEEFLIRRIDPPVNVRGRETQPKPA